ncbi:MAG: hypothetical protein ACLTSX_13150 [Collinsella sp.]
MDADTAAAEIAIMKGVVTEGIRGGKAALDDVAVAGKTGTHETRRWQRRQLVRGNGSRRRPLGRGGRSSSRRANRGWRQCRPRRSGNGSRSDGGAVVQW